MVETWEIVIVNGRQTSVDLVVEDSLYRWNDWEVTSADPKNFQRHPTHPRKMYPPHTWLI
jgi:hypothetical protein